MFRCTFIINDLFNKCFGASIRWHPDSTEKKKKKRILGLVGALPLSSKLCSVSSGFSFTSALQSLSASVCGGHYSFQCSSTLLPLPSSSGEEGIRCCPTGKTRVLAQKCNAAGNVYISIYVGFHWFFFLKVCLCTDIHGYDKAWLCLCLHISSHPCLLDSGGIWMD